MAAQDERFRAQHGSEKGQEEERGCELSPSQHACAAADGAESLDDEREAKLKHLARRSKTATMALGRERSKSAQLSAELVSVRRQLADAADGGDSDADLARSLKETKERLSNSERRLHEQKLSQQMLKAEVAEVKRRASLQAREASEAAEVRAAAEAEARRAAEERAAAAAEEAAAHAAAAAAAEVRLAALEQRLREATAAATSAPNAAAAAPVQEQQRCAPPPAERQRAMPASRSRSRGRLRSTWRTFTDRDKLST